MPDLYGCNLNCTRRCGCPVHILNNFVYIMGVNRSAPQLLSPHILHAHEDCAYAHQSITSKLAHHTHAFHFQFSPNTSVARPVIPTIHRTYNYKDNVYISKLVEGMAWV